MNRTIYQIKYAEAIKALGMGVRQYITSIDALSVQYVIDAELHVWSWYKRQKIEAFIRFIDNCRPKSMKYTYRVCSIDDSRHTAYSVVTSYKEKTKYEWGQPYVVDELQFKFVAIDTP